MQEESSLLHLDLYVTDSKKLTIENETQLNEIVKAVESDKFVVKELAHKERKKKAPMPFTTSTLQQEAANQLNFSTQKTMRIAQQLYEGVSIEGDTYRSRG